MRDKKNVMVGSGGGGGGGGSASYAADTLYSQDWLEFVIALGEGRMKGLAPGVHTGAENFFVGGTPLYSPGTGETNFPDFRIAVYPGAETDPPIKFRLGGASGNSTVNVDLVQGVPVTRTTPAMQRGHIDRLEVRVLIKQLITQTDTGTATATASFQIAYKPAKEATWRMYNGQETINVHGKTSAGAVQDYLIDVERLIDDDWEIRVTKFSSDNVSTPGTIVMLAWESFQFVEAGDKSYQHTALIHGFAKVTSQFSSLPELKSIWDGLICKVPSNFDPIANTYDETDPWDGLFKEAWTNSGPWIVHELITNPRIGLAHFVPGVTADRYAFYDVAKWAAEPVTVPGTTRTAPRFTLNETITEGLDGLELLQYLAGSFNATLIDNGDMSITIRSDRPTTPRLIVTPEAVGEEGFSYSTSDISTRYNTIIGRYRDPNLDWAPNSVMPTIDNTEDVATNGMIPHEIDLVGCTNIDEARRRLNYMYLAANNETISVSFETSRLFLFAEMYETFYVADPDADWSTGGRIKEVDGTLIHLRDPIYVSVAIDFTMRIQAYDGVRVLTVRPLVDGINYTFELVSGPLPSALEMADKAVFTIEGTGQFGMAKPFRVVRKETVENSLDKVRITAVEVDMNKYADGDAGLESAEIDYTYRRPGEPILPPELILETGRAHIQINTDGTIVNRIYANWRRPLDAFTEYYEIDYKEVGSDAWNTVTAYADSAYLGPVKDGAYYVIRLFAVAPITGRRSARFLERIDYLVAGKVGEILDATGFTATKTENGYELAWDPATISDFGGSEIRRGGVNSVWDTAQTVSQNILEPRYLLPWITEGTHRIFLKHRDTSGNYSANARMVEISASAPNIPIPEAYTRNWVLSMSWQDCTTSQPLAGYFIRWGNADGTADTATVVGNTTATTFTIPLRDPNIRKAYIRAVDLAGNVSAWAEFAVGMDDTKDLTPPPQATGLSLSSSFASVIASTDIPDYKVGHGHGLLNVYAAEGATADVSAATLVGSGPGVICDFPSELGKTYSVWAAWVTRDEVEGPWSARATVTTGRIGNTDLGDLIIEARNLAENSVTSDAIVAGALDATKFAAGIEPVTIVTSPTLPTVKSTTNISWQGSIYTWDAVEGKYKTADLGDVTFEDIGGQIAPSQIGDAVLTASMFAAGVEPVTVVSGSTLPTTKSTTVISFQGKLYRWNGSAYTASVPTTDLTGQITNTQISDNAITTPKLAVGAVDADKIAANAITSDKINANSITSAKIAAGAVTADQLAAGSVTASKMVVTDLTNLVPDPEIQDAATWELYSGWTVAPASAALGFKSTGALIFSGAAGAAGTARTKRFTVEGGSTYYLERQATSALSLFRIYWLDGDGATISSTSLSAAAGLTSGIVTAPADAKRAYVYFASPTGTPNSVGGVIVRRRFGGELVVDGSIVAGKLAANSVTATKMVLSDTSNAYPDYDALDAAAYTSTTAYTIVNASTAYGAKRVISIAHTAAATSNATVWAFDSTGIQLESNSEYLVSLQMASIASTGAVTLQAITKLGLSSGTTTNWGAESVALSLTDAAARGAAYREFSLSTGSNSRLALGFRVLQGAATGGYFGSVTIRKKAAASLIVDGAITALKIAANAVTADAIAANSITAAKIAAGAISAREIAAGAITTEKLLVTSTSSVSIDPFFQDAGYWEGTGVLVKAVSDNPYGAKVLYTAAVVSNYMPPGAIFPIDPTKTYRFEVAIRATATTTTRAFALALFYTIDGTPIQAAGSTGWNGTNGANHYFPGSGTTATTSWVLHSLAAGPEGAASIPANAAYCKLGAFFNYSTGTAVETQIGKLQVTAMSGATMIVDGAVTATKLAANSIAVGTAAIQNGAIVNAMIGNLAADKITTGTLDAARIGAGTINAGHLAANSVDATKINVATLSAINANVGTLTAGRLQNAANTQFINLSATGTQPFLSASGLQVLANGTSTFSGTLNVKSATTGSRLEITNSVILVYDAANQLRVRLGVW